MQSVNIDTFDDLPLTEREKRLAAAPVPEKVDDGWEGRLHRTERGLSRARKSPGLGKRLTRGESSKA